MPSKTLPEALAEMQDPRGRKGLIHPLPAAMDPVVPAMLVGRTSHTGIARSGRQYGHTPRVGTRLPARQNPRGFQPLSDPATTRSHPRGLDFQSNLTRGLRPDRHRRRGPARLPGRRNPLRSPVRCGCVRAPGSPRTGPSRLENRRIQGGSGSDRIPARSGQGDRSRCGVLPARSRRRSGRGRRGLHPHRQGEPEVAGNRHRGGDGSRGPGPPHRGGCPPYDGTPVDTTTTEYSEANKLHGRLEIRSIRVTAVLTVRQLWKGLKYGFRVTRERTIRSKKTVETVYGIASPSGERASPEALLSRTRDLWKIENRFHYVRDVILKEDACRVRSGSTPQLLEALRNAVVHLLADVPTKSRSEAIEILQIHPDLAHEIIGIPQCDS